MNAFCNSVTNTCNIQLGSLKLVLLLRFLRLEFKVCKESTTFFIVGWLMTMIKKASPGRKIPRVLLPNVSTAYIILSGRVAR